MVLVIKKLVEIFKVRISLTITLCSISGVFIMPYSNSFTIKELFILIICMFFSSASVSSFNQFYEKDLDKLMPRTSQRPFATGFFKTNKLWLLVFFTLLISSVLIASYFLNIASATYMFLGAFLYGYVYTILLKR